MSKVIGVDLSYATPSRRINGYNKERIVNHREAIEKIKVRDVYACATRYVMKCGKDSPKYYAI